MCFLISHLLICTAVYTVTIIFSIKFHFYIFKIYRTQKCTNGDVYIQSVYQVNVHHPIFSEFSKGRVKDNKQSVNKNSFSSVKTLS